MSSMIIARATWSMAWKIPSAILLTGLFSKFQNNRTIPLKKREQLQTKGKSQSPAHQNPPITSKPETCLSGLVKIGIGSETRLCRIAGSKYVTYSKLLSRQVVLYDLSRSIFMVHLIINAVLAYLSERPIPGMSVSMSKMSSSRRIIWAVPIPEIPLCPYMSYLEQYYYNMRKKVI